MNQEMKDAYQKHMVWVKSLQVGDLVCDCRYQHLKIISIKDRYLYKEFTAFNYFIYSNWVPNWLNTMLKAISKSLDKFFKLLKFRDLVDRQLILEDDQSCSAMNCCHPTDHSLNFHHY